MGHETTRHYSQEVEFFQRFLDPYMKYTSGLFRFADEPLDTGIVRMLDTIIDLAAMPEAPRILEIGNGWGSLLKRLHEVRPGFHYTGVNPSAVQQEYVAGSIDRGADLRVAPFEEVMDSLPGGYDAIFMIGALCHMHDKERVLRRLEGLLRDGGRVLIEDTFFLSEGLYQTHRLREETRFVQDEVFGFAHVYSLSRHLDAVRDARLRVMTTLDHSDSYARTIEIWIDRLGALDPERYPLAAQFIRYMEVFQRGWGHTISNHLMSLEKLPRRRRSAP
jgi:cyclopropane-fatty-acyl-phospholipid synthase